MILNRKSNLLYDLKDFKEEMFKEVPSTRTILDILNVNISNRQENQDHVTVAKNWLDDRRKKIRLDITDQNNQLNNEFELSTTQQSQIAQKQ